MGRLKERELAHDPAEPPSPALPHAIGAGAADGDRAIPRHLANALRGARLNALFRSIGMDCIRFMGARHSAAKDFEDGATDRGTALSPGERVLYWRASRLINEAVDARDLGSLIQAWTALRRASEGAPARDSADAPEEALRYDETAMAIDVMTFCEIFGSRRPTLH